MQITLKIHSYCAKSPGDPRVRIFNSFPITIGRSTTCDYVLNDPSRYVSSQHSAILLESDEIKIKDISANGVYVNNNSEPVGRGNTLALRAENTLSIGNYTLKLTIDQSIGGRPDPTLVSAQTGHTISENQDISSNSGYRQSEQTIQHAVVDLKLDQPALLESMTSAVQSALVKFDPDELSITLDKTDGNSANPLMSREAQLWQLFCTQYDTIRKDAISDFEDALGAELRKTYDKSVTQTS